jgi:hypothetical protein
VLPLSASSEFYVYLLPLVELLAAASSSCSRRRGRPHGSDRRLAPLPRRARALALDESVSLLVLAYLG